MSIIFFRNKFQIEINFMYKNLLKFKIFILIFHIYKFDQNPAFNWIKIISIFENIEIVKFFLKNFIINRCKN